MLKQPRMQVNSWGYDAYPVSAATGQGLQAVRSLLADKIAVVAGPSGAGKSSIINALWTQRDLQHPSSSSSEVSAPSGSNSGTTESLPSAAQPDEPPASSNGVHIEHSANSSQPSTSDQDPCAAASDRQSHPESPSPSTPNGQQAMSLQEAVPEAIAAAPPMQLSADQLSDLQQGSGTRPASSGPSPDMLVVGDVRPCLTPEHLYCDHTCTLSAAVGLIMARRAPQAWCADIYRRA